MEYAYEDLYSQLNLHRAEVERVLAEARQALDAIEQNQQLIAQHQQLTLRLQQLKVRQALTTSRISELKSNLRIARIELEALEAGPKLETKRANLSAPRRLASPSYHGAADSGSETVAELEEFSYSHEIAHISRLDQSSPPDTDWNLQRQHELSKQMSVYQLELVELVNQKAKLENHRELFKAELARTEQQLQLNGFSANRV